MADNASARIFDWTLKDTINMARVEAGSVGQVKAFLGTLESDLVGILNDNKDLSPGKIAKLNTILTAASEAIGGQYGKVKQASGDILQGVAQHQSAGVGKMINAAVGVDVMGSVLTENQIAAIASDTLVFGHSSAAWWGAQESSLKSKFAAQMKQGYALGEDVDALVRRVRGTKAGGFSDGIMQTSRREAEALVRSSVQAISNTASMEGFKKLSDTIKGIEWLSTLDTRTTPICKALDGKIWRLPDMQPVGHDKVFPGPTAHWNCRSRQIPVLRSWEELAGKKIKALDNQTLKDRIAAKMAEKGADDQQIAAAVANARASMDGQASGSPDWQKWLQGKSDVRVKESLGPSRAKLWNEGKLTISDLTDQNNRPLTVAQLIAGIEQGSIPVETEGVDFQPFDKSLLKPFEKQAAAIATQNAAKAKIEAVLANPKAVGNSIMSANLTKIQAAEPSLSPAELWAKAEEQTAAKIAANTKSSILSKAKKKLVAGEPATAAQQALIDDLGDDEKAAFLEAVADAKAKVKAEADIAKAITELAAAQKAAAEAAKLAADAAAAKSAAEAQKLASASATAAQSAQATVPHPDELKIVGTLGGTTGAKLAEDKAGNRFVVKRGAEPDHIRVEMQADDLYRSMGLNVPDGALFETSTGPVKVTKFVDGGKPLSSFTGKEREKHFATLREDFAVDALLANWDVAGTGLDNVLVTPDGKVWRIDNGGSLRYRAQGDTNGKNWNQYPDELWSMRDPSNISGPIFGKLDIFEIADQITGHDWDRLKNVPLDQATRDILDGRIAEMQRVAARAKDFGHDGYNARHTDGVARATIDIRQAGIVSSMPSKLTPKGSVPYLMEDDNGRSFGSLRTLSHYQTHTPVVQKVAGDIYSDDILIATKALASCSINAKEVTAGSAPGKMAKVIAMKPDLQALAKGTGETADMAKTYLTQIDALETLFNAGGKPADVPPLFEAMKPAAVAGKAPTPQNTTSVVKQWEALMAAEGIPIKAIYDWMDSQSGDSWSHKTQAMKVAFAKGFEDPTAFYWEGNRTKTSFAAAQTHYKAMAKATGGEDKLARLVTSWHAMTQEILSEIDSPWIDKKRRTVLLYRTVKPDEMAGALEQPDKNGVFVPYRGTTESHSIFKTTNVLAQGPTAVTTVQAVPFSRVLATYWTEKPGATSGGGFLGDGEAEFAANTSGIKALKAGPSFKQPGFDEASKHAPTWGVPLDHLNP